MGGAGRGQATGPAVVGPTGAADPHRVGGGHQQLQSGWIDYTKQEHGATAKGSATSSTGDYYTATAVDTRPVRYPQTQPAAQAQPAADPQPQPQQQNQPPARATQLSHAQAAHIKAQSERDGWIPEFQVIAPRQAKWCGWLIDQTKSKPSTTWTQCVRTRQWYILFGPDPCTNKFDPSSHRWISQSEWDKTNQAAREEQQDQQQAPQPQLDQQQASQPLPQQQLPQQGQQQYPKVHTI